MGAEDPQSHTEKCGYCGKDVSATLAAGESTCPNCGSDCVKAVPVETSEKKEPFEKVQAHSRQITFWIVLTAPSALALQCAVVGWVFEGNTNAAIGSVVVAMVVAIFSSIYCGMWLTRRILASTGTKIFLGLLIIFGIGVFNVSIVCAGCAIGNA